jgi:Bacterial surface proteins containing Ig-like domains
MKIRNKVVVTAVALAFSCAIAIPSLAATTHWNDNASKTSISTDWTNWKTKWDSVKNNYEQISLTPGSTASSLNFAWYSQMSDQANVRISATKDMNNVKTFNGTSDSNKVISGTTYYANKVSVTGLDSNKVYYYQFYVDGAWSEVKKFETKSTDKFSFLYVGDPQIGASVGQTATGDSTSQTAELAARNDAFSWNTTLKTAVDANSGVSFMISAGDQINETASDGSAVKDLQQEIEYAGYLSPSVMSSLPVATTIGNHDAMTANYQKHFNNPNSFTAETTPTKAGNDYYFTYGDALFIFIDTNNYNVADHEALIKAATQANPNTTWRIVTYHQDIYGSGLDHSDSDGIILRTQLTTLFDKYDIDVALQGHDHTYSRSYQLTSDGAAHTAYNSSVKLSDPAVKTEFLNQNLCYKIVNANSVNNVVTNPDGVLYMEANSSTGSKFYELIASQQNYIASRSQTWTPTYSVVDVTKDTLTINTYDVSTGNKIDTPYTISKAKEVVASGVSLNDVTKTLSIGGTYTLQATIAPTDTTNKSLTWASSDASIASVTSTGLVQGVKAGTATITAKTSNGKTATCTVTVSPLAVAVSGVTFNTTSKTVNVGDNFTLISTVEPSGATDKTLTWTSSDSNIAAVNNGAVTTKAVGTATIIATSSNGKIATCNVTVKPVRISKLKLSAATTLKVKKSLSIKATFTPSNVTNKSLTWKSSNKKIATVSSAGVVKGIKVGTVTITATAKDGSKKTAKIKIRIKK